MRYQLEHHRSADNRLKPRPPTEQLSRVVCAWTRCFRSWLFRYDRLLHRQRAQLNQLLERLNSTPRRNLQKASAHQRQLATRLHHSFQLHLTTMTRPKHLVVQLRPALLADSIDTSAQCCCNLSRACIPQ